MNGRPNLNRGTILSYQRVTSDLVAGRFSGCAMFAWILREKDPIVAREVVKSIRQNVLILAG